MNKKSLLIFVLTGLIFQQGISGSKYSKSTINSFYQEILFHHSYDNYA
jgi:hypothetical protein